MSYLSVNARVERHHMCVLLKRKILQGDCQTITAGFDHDFN